MATPIYQARRSELKQELYQLLSALNDSIPLNETDGSQDPVEDLGITEIELVELIRSIQAQKDQELALYRRVFPAMEPDLLFLAKRNQKLRGLYGVFPEELTSQNNAQLGFKLYPREVVLRFCRLAGWTITQYLPVSRDRKIISPEALWVPPPGTIKNGG